MKALSALLLSALLTACSSSETTTSAPDSGAADSASGDSSSSDSTSATCEKSECGSPPPSHCADGSSGTLTCGRDAKGTCTWGFSCPPASDASDGDAEKSDAPACPTTRPIRLSACTSLDQVCFYPCGVVMRCTSMGWDDDFTVDGGPPCP